MIELGGVLTASARVSLANVPRELFSPNLLQAATDGGADRGRARSSSRCAMLGGVDLAVAQYARTQTVSQEAARRAIIDNIKASGTTMAANNPDARRSRSALTRFIENPRGNADHQADAARQSAGDAAFAALKTDPLIALARFQMEASTGR